MGFGSFKPKKKEEPEEKPKGKLFKGNSESSFSSKRATKNPVAPIVPEDDEDEVSEGGGFALFTNSDDIEEEKARVASQSGDDALWRVCYSLKSGKVGRIMIRGYIGKITLHNIPAKGLRGETTSNKHICSASDKLRGDCAFCDDHYRPSIYDVYEIVDITGRVTQRGDVMENIPRFYILNEGRQAILESSLLAHYAMKQLQGKVIEVKATGTGATSVHTYKLLKGVVPDDETTSVPRFTTADMEKYFSFKSRDLQERICKEAEPIRAQGKGKKKRSSGTMDDE